jgi:hypothetical protein
MMLNSYCPRNWNSSPMQTQSEKILSTLRFEPGNLGQTTDVLANFAGPPLISNKYNLCNFKTKTQHCLFVETFLLKCLIIFK